MLFGPAVKDKNVQAFFRKIMNNPDEKPEWPEVRISKVFLNIENQLEL